MVLLTYEEYVKLIWGQSCYYCGVANPLGGADRVENALGYTVANVVPCCYVCNWMKRHLPQTVFIDHCRRIAGRFIDS